MFMSQYGLIDAFCSRTHHCPLQLCLAGAGGGAALAGGDLVPEPKSCSCW